MNSRRAFLAGACGVGLAAGQTPAAKPKPAAPPKPRPGETPRSMYSERPHELPEGPIAMLEDSAPLYGGLSWKIQHQFDEDETAAGLNDIAFASKDRGIAVGVLSRKGRDENFALLTRDGGLHWTETKMKDLPISVFLLDDSRYYCLCEDSLWYSDEAGQNWQKRKMPKRKREFTMTRLHFTDEMHGFMFGQGLSVFRTTDGGQHWAVVPEAEKLELKPKNTEWAWANWPAPQVGMIIGTSAAPPPEGSRVPDWMLPERALRRRPIPGSTVVLETHDGGTSWKGSMVSSFGHVMRMRGRGRGMAVFEYGDAMEFSSEVYEVNFQSGSNRPYFRRKNQFVFDAMPLDNGGAVVAAIESRGEMRTSPFPGPLRIFVNTGSEWRRMKVDYHATGVRATLARFDDEHIWAATDEGVILKLS